MPPGLDPGRKRGRSLRQLALVSLLTASVLVVAWATPASAHQDGPTPKEQFDRLATSVADISEDYINDTMKTISFLLLIIGWFITSERYLGPDFYADDAVTLPLLTAKLAIHLILFGTLFVLIWSLKRRAPEPPER